MKMALVYTLYKNPDTGAHCQQQSSCFELVSIQITYKSSVECKRKINAHTKNRNKMKMERKGEREKKSASERAREKECDPKTLHLTPC